MIRVKQIQELNLNLSNDSTLLSVDGSNKKVVNTIKFNSELSSNTIVKRDSDGRIKIGEPIENSHAATKSYVDNIVGDFLTINDFDTTKEESKFSNSKTIYWGNDDNDKVTANVILPKVGSLLKVGVDKDNNKIFTSSSYITENTDNKCVIIKQTDDTIGSTTNELKNVKLRIDGIKSKIKTPDIAIVSVSNDLNYSANISLYSFYDSNKDGSVSVSTSYVRNGQLLSKISFNGAISGNTFSEFSSINVYADSDFSNAQLGHLEIKQNVTEGHSDKVISTDLNGNTYIGNGLVLGEGKENMTGCIMFNPNNGHFLGYNGNSWVPLDASSEDSFITRDIYSEYNVGGIQSGDVVYAGTTLYDFAKKILNPDAFVYFDIIFEDAIAENGSLEVGQTVTVKQAEYTDNCDLEAVYVEGNGFNSSIVYTDSPIPATEETKTFTIEEGEYIWTISSDTIEGNITPTSSIQKQIVINGRYSVRFGSSSYDVMSQTETASTVISSLNPTLSDNFVGKGISFVTNNDNKESNNFTYFSYPASWGEISNVFMHGVPVADTFNKVGTFLYTNGFGVTTQYLLYQSTDRGAYRVGTKITFR